MSMDTPFGENVDIEEIKADLLDDKKKGFRPKALGLAFGGKRNSLLAYYGNSNRSNFEEPAFDPDIILQAIDTDSYIKMGFSKYKELFWKEGWEITGENVRAVNYLYHRIDLFEEIMGRSFTDFLTEAVDQFIKFGNVFIAKARGDLTGLVDHRLDASPNEYPICGYYIIPTETVRILRDKNNRTLAYKQAIDGHGAKSSSAREPRWNADDVIHLYYDRKPGRAFGTPFIVNVLDDVIALRQIEEDIQNLVHREMFPMYTYTVGTEENPSSPQEIEDAALELENLRTEGGLVLPERHKVEVLGAQNKALDATNYLIEFRNRVITGMGLAPHHLGLEGQGGNRAVADTLDKGLYDRVKLFQNYIAEAVRLHIFNELLREGGFDPLVNPREESVSDRCFMKFREIDIDSRVKKENHDINLFTNNAITWEELRMRLGFNPEADPTQLLMMMQHQLNIHLQQTTAALHPPSASATSSTSKSISTSDRPNTKTPSTQKGIPNTPNLTRGPGNISQPANQHGRRNSPNIRRMDDDIINRIIESIENKDE